MTNLTHMIRKSIAINSSDKSSDNVSFIQNGSNQQLLCDYVELLDSQLNEIQTQKMVKDTVDELLEDFKNHQTYTHHVFEHSFVIAQQSSLLTDILIEYYDIIEEQKTILVEPKKAKETTTEEEVPAEDTLEGSEDADKAEEGKDKTAKPSDDKAKAASGNKGKAVNKETKKK